MKVFLHPHCNTFSSRESNADRTKPEQNLSAVYLKTVAVTAEHLVKTKISKRQLDQVLELKASELAVSLKAPIFQRGQCISILYCKYLQISHTPFSRL